MLGKLWVACARLPVAVFSPGPPWVLSLLYGLPLLDLTMNAGLISSLGNAPLSKKVIPPSSLLNGQSSSKELWEKALLRFTLFSQKKLVQGLCPDK